MNCSQNISRLVEANDVLKSDLERQQQTEQMRRQFIANVSHDFKTPLTLMISYAEALSEQAHGEQAQECCESLSVRGTSFLQWWDGCLNCRALKAAWPALKNRSSV